MSPPFWVIILFAAMIPIIWGKRRNGSQRCSGRAGGIVGLAIMVLAILFTLKMASVRWRPNWQIAPTPVAVKPRATPATLQVGRQWVDDWQAFVNSAEPNTRWVRAESTLCGSEEDARREASQDASNQILQIIHRNFPRPNVGLTDQPLIDQIARAIDGGELSNQTHIEKNVKPYGDVWKAIILVDASNPRLQAAIIDPALVVAQAQNRRTMSQTVAAGAMLLVVALLYAFLNMATRGYFIWRLRAAAVMAVIVAMLVVLAWI